MAASIWTVRSPPSARGNGSCWRTRAMRAAYMVTAVADDGLSAFAMMGKSTRIELSGVGLIDRFDPTLRSTSVFSVSEQIAFGKEPIAGPLKGTTLALTADAQNLAPRDASSSSRAPIRRAARCRAKSRR